MNDSNKIVFKKKNVNKSFRRKEQNDEEPDNEEQTVANIEKLKEIQQLKKRTNGINVVDLLSVAPTAIKAPTDNVKQAKYGLTDAKTLAKSELDLGNTFSAETNRRDEDAEMTKYIEEELAKRKGLMSNDEDPSAPVAKTSEDIVFNELPKHLLEDTKKKSEEMLSNQMLSGIPEIDLGVNEKIRNIEATEEAKVKLIENRRKQKRDGHSSSTTLIPTNMAVNFTQHNRYNISESEPSLASAAKKPKPSLPAVAITEEPVVVIGEEPRKKEFKQYQHNQGLKHPGREKATDDYHFDRFRKQFRK